MTFIARTHRYSGGENYRLLMVILYIYTRAHVACTHAFGVTLTQWAANKIYACDVRFLLSPLSRSRREISRGV